MADQYVLNNDLRDEIYRLLKLAKSHDPQYKQPGALTHQYVLNPPLDQASLRAVEVRYEITLPEDFYWFMTAVGNGGAGPNHGIDAFPTDSTTSDDGFFDAYETAKQEAPVLPFDSSQNNLTFPWTGMVALSYWGDDNQVESMLVMTGKNRGRIVDIERDTHERFQLQSDGSRTIRHWRYSAFPIDNSSFLEWYMAWLHEAASGYHIGWFCCQELGSPEQIMASYADGDEDDRARQMWSLQKTIKSAAYLPGQGPGLSPAVERQVVDIYHHDPSLMCRISALLTMIHCETPGWIDAATEKLHELEWRNRVLRALGCKYANADTYRPEIDRWYSVLVQTLPVAVQAPDTYGFDLRPVLRMMTACGQYRVEDLLPYAKGAAQEEILSTVATNGPVPVKYLPLFLDHIAHIIHQMQDGPRTLDSFYQLWKITVMIENLMKNTPASLPAIRNRYTSVMSDLTEDFKRNLDSETTAALDEQGIFDHLAAVLGPTN